MSDRPTPEVDALAVVCYGEGGIDGSFGFRALPLNDARNLERQRDELQRAVQNHQGAIKIAVESLDKAITQRDKFRELALELRDKLRALADECLLPEFNQEWDTFVEAESALTKAKEVLP
jgi:endonuclease/exonuclease/phosphatase (EEP) superfamily protein YafD